MTKFIAEYTGQQQIWGTYEADAEDKDQFEFDLQNYIRDTHDDISDIVIEGIKEVG